MSDCGVSEEWRHKSIRQRLRFALTNRESVDVHFLVGAEKEKISAHKLILSLSSAEFRDIIETHEVETQLQKDREKRQGVESLDSDGNFRECSEEEWPSSPSGDEEGEINSENGDESVDVGKDKSKEKESQDSGCNDVNGDGDENPETVDKGLEKEVNEAIKMIRSQVPIKFPEIRPSIFRKLLEFIYTDELELEDLSEVLVLALQFGFTRLADQTRANLEGIEVTADNAIELLNVALIVDDSVLELRALRYIKVNADKMFESRDFDKLSSASLKEVVKQNELMAIKEEDIFRGVLRWGRNQLKSDSKNAGERPEGIRMRALLGATRFLIRFCDIPYDIMMSEVKGSGMLTPDELLRVLRTWIDPTDNPCDLVTRSRFNGFAPPQPKSSFSGRKRNWSEMQIESNRSNVVLIQAPVQAPPPSQSDQLVSSNIDATDKEPRPPPASFNFELVPSPSPSPPPKQSRATPSTPTTPGSVGGLSGAPPQKVRPVAPPLPNFNAPQSPASMPQIPINLDVPSFGSPSLNVTAPRQPIVKITSPSSPNKIQTEVPQTLAQPPSRPSPPDLPGMRQLKSGCVSAASKWASLGPPMEIVSSPPKLGPVTPARSPLKINLSAPPVVPPTLVKLAEPSFQYSSDLAIPRQLIVQNKTPTKVSVTPVAPFSPKLVPLSPPKLIQPPVTAAWRPLTPVSPKIVPQPSTPKTPIQTELYKPPEMVPPQTPIQPQRPKEQERKTVPPPPTPIQSALYKPTRMVLPPTPKTPIQSQLYKSTRMVLPPTLIQPQRAKEQERTIVPPPPTPIPVQPQRPQQQKIVPPPAPTTFSVQPQRPQEQGRKIVQSPPTPTSVQPQQPQERKIVPPPAPTTIPVQPQRPQEQEGKILQPPSVQSERVIPELPVTARATKPISLLTMPGTSPTPTHSPASPPPAVPVIPLNVPPATPQNKASSTPTPTMAIIPPSPASPDLTRALQLNGGSSPTCYILAKCSITSRQLVESIKAKDCTLTNIFLKDVKISNTFSEFPKLFLPKLTDFTFIHDFQPGDINLCLPPLPDNSFLNGSSLVRDFLFFDKVVKNIGNFPLANMDVRINVNVRGIQYMLFDPVEKKLILAYPEQSDVDLLLANPGKLRSLSLASCVLNDVSRFPFSSLQHLVLQSVGVVEMTATRLINSCACLQTLSLYEAPHPGRAPTARKIMFDSNLRKCANTLRKLSLSSALIHGWSYKLLRSSHIFTRLQELHLNICDIAEETFVPYFQGKMPNLQKFRMRSKDSSRPNWILMKKLLKWNGLLEIGISRYHGAFDSGDHPNICGEGSRTCERLVLDVLRDAGVLITENATDGQRIIPDFVIRRSNGRWGADWKVVLDPRELTDESYNFSDLKDFISDPTILQLIL